MFKARKSLIDDLTAGVTGAVTGAPQAMGFAVLAGLNPLYGLYAAFVTTITASLFSSSPLLVYAPTNALALVTGSALLLYTQSQHLDVLVTLSVLTGVFMLLIGFFRLGRLTRFVSNAVMTGFITGAGLLIMLGQLGNLTGYDTEQTRVPLINLWNWLIHLDQTDFHTIVVGALAMLTILLIQRTRFGNYATLVAILLVTALKLWVGWDDVAIVRDISEIPRGLPIPFLPDVSLTPGLISTAFAMAILASVQSAALIESTPNPDNKRPDVSRDFLAMGVGNIVGGLLRGMPSCASLSRTAININAGAKTQRSNIVAGAVIGLSLILFSDLIEEVPLAVLAGQLILAAWSLIDPHEIGISWRVNRSARTAMLVTFGATLLLPLQYSIYLGVGLSLLLYVYTSVRYIKLVRLVPTADGHFRTVDVPQPLPSNEVVVLSVHGNLFFAAIRRLEDLLPSVDGCENTVIILRIRENQFFGGTGIRTLSRYAQQLRQRGGRFILAGVAPAIQAELERTGAVEHFGAENIYPANDVVFNATEHAYADAQAWVHKDAVS